MRWTAALLISLSSALVMAKATIVSQVSTGHILNCTSNEDLFMAYQSNKAAVETIEAVLAKTKPDLKQYLTLSTLLELSKKNLEQSAELIGKFDSVPMAVVTVTIDSAYRIATKKLGIAAGEGKIAISPSTSLDNTLNVSAGNLKITFYGAKFCPALTEAGGNASTATEKLIGELFHK